MPSVSRPFRHSERWLHRRDAQLRGPRRQLTCLKFPLAFLVDPPEDVASVIGDHHWYSRLRPRDHAHQAVMGVYEINRTVSKALTQLKDSLGVNEITIAIFQHHRLYGDAGPLD